MYIRAIAILLSFLCLTFAVPVYAYDENTLVSPTEAAEPLIPSEPPISGESSAPEESSGSETVETQTVFSLEELQDWISRCSSIGGTVRLGCDLTVEKDTRWQYIGWAGQPVITIDAGPYSIRIQGIMEVHQSLAFVGEGGEKGVLHIERGGLLECHSSVTAINGFAVYQEEGAVLVLDETVPEETVHFAKRPVVWPANDLLNFYPNVDQPVVTLPYEGPFDPTVLPDTFPSCVYQNGKTDYELHEIPVEWNLSEYQDELRERKRFLLEGRFTEDFESYGDQPRLLITFLRQDAAVFLQCAVQERHSATIFDAGYLLDDPHAEHWLESSYDGEVWEAVDKDLLEYWCDENTVGQVDVMAIYTGADLPNYFSVAVVGQDGKTRYSDTVEVTEQNQVTGSDIGGGRNGETSPFPPAPPENSGGLGSINPEEAPGAVSLGSSEGKPPRLSETNAVASDSAASATEQPPQSQTPEPVPQAPPEPAKENLTEPTPDKLPASSAVSPVLDTAGISSVSESSPPQKATMSPLPTQPHKPAVPPGAQIILGWTVLLLLGAPVYFILTKRKK
ncbi:hypothetical protein [Anaerotruncus colihominis]|uniref:hypothetical protein n=1 Tax=Anaerotruncus colihominis TaxID=169435 RepID=UPI0035114994